MIWMLLAGSGGAFLGFLYFQVEARLKNGYGQKLELLFAVLPWVWAFLGSFIVLNKIDDGFLGTPESAFQTVFYYMIVYMVLSAGGGALLFWLWDALEEDSSQIARLLATPVAAVAWLWAVLGSLMVIDRMG